MEATIVSELILPLAIFIIMVTMGMTLTIDDFRRVLASPKQIGVGYACQMVLLPLIGFAVASLFPLEAVFAISIVLLAASPGGTTSNLIIHAAEGDRALSVSLTALSNATVWLTIPFLLNLAYRVFGDGAQAIDFPVADTMLQVAALTIVPVIIGMTIRRYRPMFAERSKDASKIFAGVFLLLVIVALVIQNWETVVSDGPRFAPAFIALNFGALLVGYWVARGAGLDGGQATTISIETGLQNSTLAITIALSLLGSSEMAIIPGLYGLWMLATGFPYAIWMSRRRRSMAGAPA